MALSNDQLLDRIVALESSISDMSTALNNLATKKELKNLFGVLQDRVDTAIAEDDLEERITTIENTLNTLQTALNNVAARKTLNATMAIKQQEIIALQDRVTELESQIALLQASA